MAFRPSVRMGPPPRSSLPMRITASWFGSLAHRIQGCWHDPSCHQHAGSPRLRHPDHRQWLSAGPDRTSVPSCSGVSRPSPSGGLRPALTALALPGAPHLGSSRPSGFDDRMDPPGCRTRTVLGSGIGQIRRVAEPGPFWLRGSARSAGLPNPDRSGFGDRPDPPGCRTRARRWGRRGGLHRSKCRDGSGVHATRVSSGFGGDLSGGRPGGRAGSRIRLPSGS